MASRLARTRNAAESPGNEGQNLSPDVDYV
jgi:hypothetical protein